MKTAWAILALPLLGLACPAMAQTAGTVLSGKDITETALIEALTPVRQPSEEAILTRSIRVNRNDAPRATPARPASASLLITFETNSAALTPHARHALDVVGEALRSDKLAEFRFAIQGHADPRGDADANLKLSQSRAESVRQYLVQNKRIEDRRLEAIGKGDKELMNHANPIAPENRRVTIVNLTQ
ncbi:MAG TPA: OmpA family protein [Telluria sp.]|jgi:outer membrane protein OmpA-like peptidoglycan-associated protein